MGSARQSGSLCFFCNQSACYCLFFFFQAEDGIRYRTVTGVQTCVLPICDRPLDAGRAGGVDAARAREFGGAERLIVLQGPGTSSWRLAHGGTEAGTQALRSGRRPTGTSTLEVRPTSRFSTRKTPGASSF